MTRSTEQPSVRAEDIEAALRRAAERARRVAARAGTPLVILKDGRVVEIPVTTDDPAPDGIREAS